MERIIKTIPKNELNASSITDLLHNYTLNIINPTRTFMEKYPANRVPSNYRAYPGRLDHATILVYKI